MVCTIFPCLVLRSLCLPSPMSGSQTFRNLALPRRKLVNYTRRRNLFVVWNGKEREQPPFLSLGGWDHWQKWAAYQEDRNSHLYMGLYKSCSFLDLHMYQHRNFHIPCTPCYLGIPDLQTKMEYVTDVFKRSLKLLCRLPNPFFLLSSISCLQDFLSRYVMFV